MTVVDVLVESNVDKATVLDIMANCQDLKQDEGQKAADLVGNPTEKPCYNTQNQRSNHCVKQSIRFLLVPLTSTWQHAIKIKKSRMPR